MTHPNTHLPVSAPEIVAELLLGNTQSTFSVTDFLGKTAQTTLTHLVACDLCDTPESVLRTILAYLGKQAKAGDQQALAIIGRLAVDIEMAYGSDRGEPVTPEDRRDAMKEWLGVTQA